MLFTICSLLFVVKKNTTPRPHLNRGKGFHEIFRDDIREKTCVSTLMVNFGGLSLTLKEQSGEIYYLVMLSSRNRFSLFINDPGGLLECFSNNKNSGKNLMILFL